MTVFPQQPYPAPYPVQPPPMNGYPGMDAKQMRKEKYRRSLRKTANSLGGLMLIFFGAELVIAVVLTLFLMAIGAKITEEMTVLMLLENGLISMLVFFAVGLIYCLIKRLSFHDIFPFEKIKASLLAQMCVIGISISLMSNYVVQMLSGVFGLFGVENKGGDFETGSDPNVFLYILTIAIMPALVEEFAFRGVIMGSLKPYSPGLAIIVSSALFALMHGNFVQMPFTFCCGLIFAYMDIKANSLLPSIIVHFLNNVFSVLADVLMAYKVLNSYQVNMAYGIIFAVTGLLSFIFLKKTAKNNDGSLFTLDKGSSALSYKEKVKTVASSPTMIVFAAIMAAYSVSILFSK